MRITTTRWAALAVTALIATGCGLDEPAANITTVPATFSLTQGATDALASAASGLVSDFVGGGPIDMSQVDSLIVTVTRVDVLPDSLILNCFPPVGDSARGYRPDPMGPGGPLGRGRPGCRPMGHFGIGGPMGPGGDGRPRFGRPPIRPDSLRPDSGFGRPMHHWYSLDISGSGRLDLVHLPTTAGSGLSLASGSLPAGDYGAARLLVSDATIWFNTAITSGGGVTLQPNTAYTVQLPRMADRVGLITNAGFTVPDGGGTIELVFDAAATVAHAGVTDSGTVVLPPVLRPRHPH